ncbi:MAG: type II secretion system protein GspF [Acidobacteria bacterium]|nr:MAG: type II secretion system protein GspF [Acidobacteriota bacterium]
MGRFLYKATTRTGELHSGEMEGSSAEDVKEKLKTGGMIPFEVMEASEATRRGLRNLDIHSIFHRGRKVRTSDVLVFTEKFAVLLKSGLPLDRSLSLLVELSEKEGIRVVAESLLKDVNAGKSLADSMENHSEFFPRLYVSMVRAGEAAGVIDRVMEQLLSYLRQKEELRGYIISSLIYPALLLLVGLATIGILMTYVIPKFKEIFDSMNQELPAPTRFLMGVSDFILGYKWIILIVIVGIVYGYRHWVSTPEGRAKKDRIILKLPLIKRLVTEGETGRLAATAGILLTSAVPLIQTLKIVQELLSNTVFREAMVPVVSGAKKGDGVAGPMLNTGVFPPLAVHLVRVGEESGNLGPMFVKVGDIYQESIRKSVKSFLALFEPALILVMGVIVGVIVASMLLAIFSMNDAPF